ncbi:MAG: hypothetical protein FWD53_10185, partial [Phycisphaerales bacterium]|nr:hypothetical protein [Phycisphaerales bacterium]
MTATEGYSIEELWSRYHQAGKDKGCAWRSLIEAVGMLAARSWVLRDSVEMQRSDLVNEAVIQVVETLGRYNPSKGSFAGFVYWACVRVVQNHRRNRMRRPHPRNESDCGFRRQHEDDDGDGDG